MYKLLSTSRGSDDLSIGFDRNRDRRKREFTNNKNIKGTFHLRNYLGDVFGFDQASKSGDLINGGLPVIINSNMLTFRDSSRSIKLDGDLLETIKIMISTLTILINRI